MSRPTSSGSSNNVKKVNITLKPTSSSQNNGNNSQNTGIMVTKVNNFLINQVFPSKKGTNTVTSPPQEIVKSKNLSPADLKVLKHTLNSGGELMKNSEGESLINISLKKKEMNVRTIRNLKKFRSIKPGTSLCPHFTQTTLRTHPTSLQYRKRRQRVI